MRPSNFNCNGKEDSNNDGVQSCIPPNSGITFGHLNLLSHNILFLHIHGMTEDVRGTQTANNRSASNRIVLQRLLASTGPTLNSNEW